MKALVVALLMIFSVAATAQNRETRDVKDFDEVVMRISGKVYIKLG